MRLRSILTGAVLSVCTLFASTASAWSFKEHIQFTRLAAQRIVDDPGAPDDLKAWLKANTELLNSMDAEQEYFLHASVSDKPDPAKLSGLLWWVCVPDLEANDRGSKRVSEPSGLHERLNHFIDLEFFNPEGPKRQFQQDMSAMPPLSAMPRDLKFEMYSRAGFLPFAREHAYQKLVDAIKAGKLAPDPASPEDQDHALRWAAYLVHYTQDNTQPHHATMDYKSASFFKEMRTQPNVHSEMEWRMADDATQPLPELRADFWLLFAERLGAVKDDIGDADVFESTLNVAMDSYKNLTLIGEAAQAAVVTTDPRKPTIDTDKFFRFEGTVDGRPQSVMQMKAHQTAWAVIRTENVLRQAWAEANGK